MTPHKNIRQQGHQAFIDGKLLESNPYQWTPQSRQGPHKQAAWSAGWKDAEKSKKK